MRALSEAGASTLLLLSSAIVCAGHPATARFVIHSKDGPLAPAEVVSLRDGWIMEPAGNDKPLAAADWIGCQQQGKHRPAPPTDHFVLFSTGDRLSIKPGQRPRLADGRLHFTPAPPLRSHGLEDLSIFAPYVAMLWMAAPDGVDDPALFLIKLQRDAHQSDVVLLRNGDRIEGTVTALTAADGCEILADGRKIVTPWPKLSGIAFATSSLARPRPRKLYGLAVLAGGARLQLASLRYSAADKEWSGRTTTGMEVAVATEGLVALDLFGGHTVYLSDMKPLAHAQTGYLGLRWPIGVDAALDGGPLRIGAEVYDKGLSLHAQCRVTYRLGGDFRWFETVVGIDPAAGPKGRARMIVLVDKKAYPLGEGKEQTAEDAPLPVRLDVRDAQELTLVVEYGSFADVQSRVHWGAARLLK